MDRAEVIGILEGEVREAKGIAKVQAIKLLLAEMDRELGDDARPVPGRILKLAEGRRAS